MTMRSPNEFLEAAKEISLGGRDPVTRDDWAIVINFVACNVLEGFEDVICKTFRLLYPECEAALSEDEINQIAAFQITKKQLAKGTGKGKVMKLSKHEIWRLINALERDTDWRTASVHKGQYEGEIAMNLHLLQRLRAEEKKVQ
jgi:hypothetical protein